MAVFISYSLLHRSFEKNSRDVVTSAGANFPFIWYFRRFLWQNLRTEFAPCNSNWMHKQLVFAIKRYQKTLSCHAMETNILLFFVTFMQMKYWERETNIIMNAIKFGMIACHISPASCQSESKEFVRTGHQSRSTQQKCATQPVFLT